MTTFPDRVRIFRPGAGSYDADDRFVPGVDVEVHEGAASVQDKPRTLERASGTGDPVVNLEVRVYLAWQPMAPRVIGAAGGPVAGDFADVTQDGVTRSGSVRAVAPLDQSLTLRWVE